MAQTFKPTQKMADNARRGLELRAEFGRGGTEVGVARARQLAERRDVSEADVKSMYSYFARHTVDKRADNWGNPIHPSAGYIAWLLWGGDEGQAWATAKRARINEGE
ncbi:hypothetical protein [Sphingomonas quercus]|uniref:DNA-binding protein n=1 Tax=Sphingomonas quercus TaxID=2842451 RepID=A0ABS6BGJ6_9SPHN|nr:hypothetical protein [Sphingomonas quercus]MBU3076702.1 hypothetical protein [Sphingomonas quercus]